MLPSIKSIFLYKPFGTFDEWIMNNYLSHLKSSKQNWYDLIAFWKIIVSALDFEHYFTVSLLW